MVTPELTKHYGDSLASELLCFVHNRCKEAGFSDAEVKLSNLAELNATLTPFVFCHPKDLLTQARDENNRLSLRFVVTDQTSIASQAFNHYLSQGADAVLNREALTSNCDLSQSWHELFNQTIVEYFKTP
jgi:hypothetical protein